MKKKKKIFCLAGALLLLICCASAFLYPGIQWTLTVRKAFAQKEARLCTLLKEPPYRKRIPLTAEQKQELHQIFANAERIHSEDKNYQSIGQIEFGSIGPGVMRVSLFLIPEGDESGAPGMARLRYLDRYYETKRTCSEIRTLLKNISAAESCQL